MSVKLPACLQLGTAGGERSGNTCRIQGNSVRFAGDLPEYLLGARLEKDSFAVRMVGSSWEKFIGSGRPSWSARWRGPGSGDGVRVSWDPDAGWTFAADWHGKTLNSGYGFMGDNLADAMCKALRFIPSGFEDWLEKSGDESLPLFIKTPKGTANPVFAPDGYFVDLSIPLSAGSITSAADLFSDLSRRRLICSVIGGIFLCQCRSCKKNLPNQAEGRRYVEAVRSGDGLPLAGEPLFTDGMVQFTRNAYVLRVTVPYYSVMMVLEHFDRVARRGVAGKPFMLGTPFSRTLANVTFRKGDETVNWVFREDWRTMPPPNFKGDLLSFVTDVSRALEASPTGNSDRLTTGTGSITITRLDNRLVPMDADLVREFSGFSCNLIFFANVVVAPVEPVFEFLCAEKEEVAPGKKAGLYYFLLSPAKAAWKPAGTIEFSDDWNGSWDGVDAGRLAGFLEAPGGVGIIAPGLWLPEGARRRLLEEIYSERGDDHLPQVLAQVELFPDDIYARFDADLAELKPYKYPDKLIPRSRLLSRSEAAAGLVRRCLDRDFQHREFMNLVYNWYGCEKVFPRAEPRVSLEDFRRYYDRSFNRDLYRHSD